MNLDSWVEATVFHVRLLRSWACCTGSSLPWGHSLPLWFSPGASLGEVDKWEKAWTHWRRKRWHIHTITTKELKHWKSSSENERQWATSKLVRTQIATYISGNLAWDTGDTIVGCLVLGLCFELLHGNQYFFSPNRNGLAAIVMTSSMQLSTQTMG